MRNSYMNIKYTYIALCLAFSIVLKAQVSQDSLSKMIGTTYLKEVTGTIVNSEDSLPILNVAVYKKGKNQGVYTNSLGEFMLRIPVLDGQFYFDTIFVLTHPEFESKEINIKNGNAFSIVLDKKISKINNGFYENEEQFYPGVVERINADDINNLNYTSLDQAFQGRLTGVHSTQSSGVTGAAVISQVRAPMSLYGFNDPLYIVDGIPIVTSRFGDGIGSIGQDYGAIMNPLANLESKDIE